MSSFSLGLIHTCSIISKTQDQKLLFKYGAAEITEGSILTGSNSGVYGTVKSIHIPSQDIVLGVEIWDSGVAEGYVILSNVSGEFEDEEPITTDAGGSAVADGTNIPHYLDYGVPSYTESTTSTSCRFINENGKRGAQQNDTGEHLVDESVLMLPNTITPKEGDTVEAYSEQYRITGVQKIHNFFNNSIHHYECDIRRVD